MADEANELVAAIKVAIDRGSLEAAKEGLGSLTNIIAKSNEEASKTPGYINKTNRQANLAGAGGLKNMVRQLANGNVNAAAMAAKMTLIGLSVAGIYKMTRLFIGALSDSIKVNKDLNDKAKQYADLWQRIKTYIGDSLASLLKTLPELSTLETIAQKATKAFEKFKLSFKTSSVNVEIKTLQNGIAKLDEAISVMQKKVVKGLLPSDNAQLTALMEKRELMQEQLNIQNKAMQGIVEQKKVIDETNYLQKNNTKELERQKEAEKAKKEAIEESKKALEEQLKMQQATYRDMGVATGKNLKDWDKDSDLSAPNLSGAEIFAGESGLGGNADGMLEVEAERNRLKALNLIRQDAIYAERDARIEATNNLLADEQAKADAIIQINQSAAEALAINQQQYNAQQTKLDKLSAQAKQQTMGNMWNALTALSASSNKNIAKVGKVAGIAQGTISMFTGAAKALELPFPYNLAAAATVLAQGVMLVDQIKSINVDGGGAVAAATGGVPSVTGMQSDISSQMKEFGVSGVNRNISGQDKLGAVPITINFNATGGVEAFATEITEAIRNGVVEANQMSNIIVKGGNKTEGLAV